MYGNINELGDASGSPGKSSLFFLTTSYPGISLPGDLWVCFLKVCGKSGTTARSFRGLGGGSALAAAGRL